MTAEASDEILQEQHCGGRDLISNPLLTSPDGKLIFVRDYNKVTVFNADTGQPVRELNTGASLGIALDKGMLIFLYITFKKTDISQLL